MNTSLHHLLLQSKSNRKPWVQQIIMFSAIIFALFFITGINTAAAQTPTVGSFSTIWQTDNPGSSNDTQITIPTASGSTYNYDIYWEDVNDSNTNGTLSNNTGSATIIFPSAGTYRVDITGTFPRIFFNNTGDRQKILSIEQWGTIEWASMERAFRGASNLTYNATDAPDLSGVTSMGGMFQEASSFIGDLDTWDLTTVTNLADMFKDATNFDGALNGWGTTTANVESMFGMFDRASSFNQPLSDWDVSSVNNMTAMFKDATSFNQSLNTWDVSSVTNMFWMFNGATSFNGSVNGWGASTANVTDMQSMFEGAANFNQPLDAWDVSGVTNTAFMFNGATSFNQPLNGWGTRTAAMENIERMFEGAANFNQPLDAWDVSSSTDMRNIFRNAANFNQPLGTWNISGLSTTSGGFNDAFIGTAWDRDNYSSTLQAWTALVNTPENITLRTDAQYTSSAQAGRQNLIDNNNWTISDGGLYVPPVVVERSNGGGGTRICNSETTTNCRQPRNRSAAIDAADPEREQLVLRIAELQQLIKELQAQVESTSVPAVSTDVVVVSNCTFTRDLTIGVSGEDVTCLQTYLTQTGDYKFAEGPTGYFGSITEQAVQSWQARVGVNPTNGYFGPLSQNTLRAQ